MIEEERQERSEKLVGFLYDLGIEGNVLNALIFLLFKQNISYIEIIMKEYVL